LGLLKDNITDLNKEIIFINKKHEIYIDLAQEEWSVELIEDLSGWWKILRARRVSEIETQRRKEIEEHVEKRCQMIDGKQGKMLRSILEKPIKKLQIDRLIGEEDNKRRLYIEPEEVLNETRNHFQSQFRSRQFNSEIFNERWREVYEPKKSIEEDWYCELNQSITEEEWNEMLAELKKNTAPGISGITYTLIQAAGEVAQKIFRIYTEICIVTGKVPEK